MEEPSVLDYVKSKLAFWRESRITFPSEETIGETREVPRPQWEGRPPVDATLKPPSPVERLPEPSIKPEPARLPEFETETEGRIRRGAVWGSLVALLLGLLAQSSLEPPDRNLTAGLILYGLAVAWLLWSHWRGGWRLSGVKTYVWEEGETGSSSGFRQKLTLYPASLVASVALSLIAFVAFGGNRFTRFNLLVWGMALAAFIQAFWVWDVRTRGWIDHLRDSVSNIRYRGISLSPWTLLVLTVFILSAFFRFYALDQVLPEMFSDHAEKLWDVADVLNGETRVFFPRNTGREAIQMYLTAAVARIFGTGLSFLSLKIGTAFAGFVTLPYIYLLGKEVANRRVGLLAVAFAGIAYWPNLISRVALRFALYPLFVAPTLFYLFRGLKRRQRNDFILAGIALGLGLHGYSPFRFVPFVVMVAVGVYILHRGSKGWRNSAIFGLVLTLGTSLILFLPLLRYAFDNPDLFSYRMMTRLTSLERNLPGSAWSIFLKNLGRVVVMMAWDNGETWVHSIPHRPALGVISAALFYLGVVLLLVRYVRRRHWMDLFLVLSVPLLMMPSALSLAFPGENPSLNRTAGALVPVFLIIGMALEGLLRVLKSHLLSTWGRRIAWGLGFVLLFLSASQNYDLLFNQFVAQYRLGSWNTSELGAVIRTFSTTIGDKDSAWVVPYPHWVDTRLVGIRAGYPSKDYALWPDELHNTLSDPGAKLFLFKPEDEETPGILRDLYPNGVMSQYDSEVRGKDFWMYFAPPQQ